MRVSIVIGARSRSFRFLVRLVERMPVLALPAWRDHRTAPVDGRDMLEFLTRAATAPSELSGRSWDIAGPDVMSYGDLVERIADAMLVRRLRVGIDVTMTGLASVVASAIADEDLGLIAPLMESPRTRSPAAPRGRTRPSGPPALASTRPSSARCATGSATRSWRRDEHGLGHDRHRPPAGGGLEDDHATPPRYSQWVSIHRKIARRRRRPGRARASRSSSGSRCAACRSTVHWTLTECDRPKLGVVEGNGPAHSYARVTNKLSPNGNGGTHFEYENHVRGAGRRDGPARLARPGRRHAQARGRQVSLRHSRPLLERADGHRPSTSSTATSGELVLDAPPLNLFGPAMFDDLEAAIVRGAGGGPRALLFRAQGDVVSAGVDVHVFDGPRLGRRRRDDRRGCCASPTRSRTCRSPPSRSRTGCASPPRSSSRSRVTCCGRVRVCSSGWWRRWWESPR